MKLTATQQKILGSVKQNGAVMSTSTRTNSLIFGLERAGLIKSVKLDMVTFNLQGVKVYRFTASIA